ncbi:MAG: DJ-1/PfpI family protein [Defluviitaleaceae bacterium]|nr:DJ-1/PfpI family protein [Defluviitaleaceae bacterium]
MKEVLLLLTDHWADWEAGFAIAGISQQYHVKTIAIDKLPKASIGGMRAEIDCKIAEYQSFGNLAMVILVGSFSWGEGRHDEIAGFVRDAHATGVPIAAICGATIFLARHGFLDNIKHTGDDAEYFAEMLQGETGYNGQENFTGGQVVSDGGIITATETAAIEFAREIFRMLQTDSNEEIDAWYRRMRGCQE